MADWHHRYQVNSGRGPFVGYSVWDSKGQTHLTADNLFDHHALRLAAELLAADAPREARGTLRLVTPLRKVLIRGDPGLLALWAPSPQGWMGLCLAEMGMKSEWVPQDDLAEMPGSDDPAPGQ